eukprot:m.144859 g.144859  ORF g.144859 m.144859 type:complete len:572 (-) comp17206_c1_seq4:55-1770(-)
MAAESDFTAAEVTSLLWGAAPATATNAKPTAATTTPTPSKGRTHTPKSQRGKKKRGEAPASERQHSKRQRQARSMAGSEAAASDDDNNNGDDADGNDDGARVLTDLQVEEYEDEFDSDDEQAPPVSFADLGLHKWLVRQCSNLGLTSPTPVQRACIPAILRGRDVSASAKTGSGKTLAFALPMLQVLSKDPYGIFAVVLTPTRELALQIADQFRAFGNGVGLRDAVIIGGVDMVRQSVQLSRRPHIVIATPGRLADHLLSSAGSISLKRVRFVVLDEADRLMTNSTLQPDLNVIWDAIPTKQRQTLMFSATMPDTLTGRVADSLKQPLFVYQSKSDTKTVETLLQEYVFMPSRVRHCYLINVLRALIEEDDASCIVFTSTCRSCAELGIVLRELGFRCVTLHSQMTQADRIASLDKFKSDYIKLLVATDVASRGLDIPTVEVVVNFNVPKAVEDYIHRVGRTARIGRGGRAVTLVSERDIDLVHAVEEVVGVKMQLFEELKEKDVLDSLNEVNIARRTANMQLMEANFGERRRIHRAKQQVLAAEVARASGKSKGKKSSKKKKKKEKKQSS